MKIRGHEEIQGSLQTFRDVYKDQFGKDLDNAKAVEIITQMLSKRELEVIQQRFFDFRPQDLKTLIEMLNTKPEEPEVESSQITPRKVRGKK